jgi:hypothetical protein
VITSRKRSTVAAQGIGAIHAANGRGSERPQQWTGGKLNSEDCIDEGVVCEVVPIALPLILGGALLEMRNDEILAYEELAAEMAGKSWSVQDGGLKETSPKQLAILTAAKRLSAVGGREDYRAKGSGKV